MGFFHTTPKTGSLTHAALSVNGRTYAITFITTITMSGLGIVEPPVAFGLLTSTNSKRRHLLELFGFYYV